jgi:hypothetical protein
MNREKTMKVKLNVGDVFTVAWSNGHGESDYRVVDTFNGGHDLGWVADREFGDGDDGMTDDDMAAVFADIVARRGVAE